MKNKHAVPGRRDFLLKSAVLAGSAWPLFQPWPVLSQAPIAQTERLADRVLFVKGPHSNVLVVDSSEGLILIDGGHADWAAELHRSIAQHFPGRPYRALFNTQWHPEQTGSNVFLGEQGVDIIAHENTALWLGTEVWQRWSDRTFAPLPAAALPVTTFYEDGMMQIGDRSVHYGYMRGAHTDGDIWVYIEEEDVLVTGGLVSNGRWPEIDWWTGGFIGSMLDSFVSLLSVPSASTKIIPAYGGLMTLAELRAQNQMYLTIVDRLHAAFIRADSLEDILAQQLTAEFDATMGEPTLFMTLAFQSIEGHLRDPLNERFLNLP